MSLLKKKETKVSPANRFEELVVRAVINKAVQGLQHRSWFDVTELKDVLQAQGRYDWVSWTKDYKTLHHLHCVNWSQMSPELRMLVRAKFFALIGIPNPDGEVIDAEIAEVSPEKKTGFLSWFKRGD